MSLTEFKVEAKLFVIDKTDVSIKKEYPYTFIRRSLPGNWTDKSDEAIINAVVEVVNTEFDPTSAIAKFTLLQNEMKQTIEHTKKNSEIGQKALLELAGQVTEVVTDIEILKTAVFGEGHENEEEHSTDTVPTTPSTTPVAPTAPEPTEHLVSPTTGVVSQPTIPVTPQPTAPVVPTPEVTPQPTAPVATEPTSTVPETAAQPVAPTIPTATITTTNLNMEVEHNESTETNIPQGQPTGISSENTTSVIPSVQ